MYRLANVTMEEFSIICTQHSQPHLYLPQTAQG